MKRIKAIDYKNEIIDMYENGLSCVKIRKYFKNKELQISEQSISSFLKENGYKTGNSKFKFSDEEEKDIIEMYKNGLTLKEICDKYGRICNKPISKILKNNGVIISMRTRNTSRAARINEDYFDLIDTQEKAYFLGFIMADGCLLKVKTSYYLVVDVKVDDKYILEKFSEEINGNSGFLNKKRNHYRISYGSKKLGLSLIKNGVIPRKTGLEVLPKTVPNNLIRHFIRGYFDGDGTVFIRKDNSKKHNIRLEFGFSGNYNLLSSIKTNLINNISINNNKIVKRKNTNLSQLMFSKLNDIENFYNYIYKDSKIHLERKKEKFELFLKLYGNTEVTVINGVRNA